jgi:hypothetical protein
MQRAGRRAADDGGEVQQQSGPPEQGIGAGRRRDRGQAVRPGFEVPPASDGIRRRATRSAPMGRVARRCALHERGCGGVIARRAPPSHRPPRAEEEAKVLQCADWVRESARALPRQCPTLVSRSLPLRSGGRLGWGRSRQRGRERSASAAQPLRLPQRRPTHDDLPLPLRSGESWGWGRSPAARQSDAKTQRFRLQTVWKLRVGVLARPNLPGPSARACVSSSEPDVKLSAPSAASS